MDSSSSVSAPVNRTPCPAGTRGGDSVHGRWREGGTGADPNRSRRAEYPFSASVCDRRAAVRGRGTAGRGCGSDSGGADAFDYVALGHIHSPQKVGRETVRYCGSPLKYSFSEAGQEKSITIVELKEKGTVELRTIPLKPLHDLRKIRGTYLEVTAKTFYENSDRTDYLMVTLTDEEDVPDGMAKLRTIYPNLMRLEYDNKRTRSNAEVTAAERIEEKSELELFQEFYELQNNQSMTEQQKAFVKALLRGIKR